MEKNYIIPIAIYENAKADFKNKEHRKRNFRVRPLTTEPFPYKHFGLPHIDIPGFSVSNLVVTLVNKNILIEWENPTSLSFDNIHIFYNCTCLCSSQSKA